MAAVSPVPVRTPDRYVYRNSIPVLVLVAGVEVPAMARKRKADNDDEDSEGTADFTDSEDEAFIDDDSDDGTSSKRR